MTWLELDDRILEHPKFIRAVKLGGSEAVHMWLGVRAYCGQNLTDGFVPGDMVDEVRGPAGERKRAAAMKTLKDVGLLEDKDGGIQMHDFLDWSSSREAVLERRGKARERKAKSRGPSRRDSGGDGGSDGHGDSGRDDEGTAGGVTGPRAGPPARALPSSPLHSGEEENPPTPLPKPRDRFAESFTNPPRSRPDVLALFELWKITFLYPDAKLGLGIWNTDAETLAESIDAHGMASCELVMRHAPSDGMVSGRDDERRVKHETIAYIFGNQNAFLRILRAARDAERNKGVDAVDDIRRRKEART